MSRMYEKNSGTYYLMDGKTIVHADNVIAVAFAMDNDGVATMHKIGPSDSVEEWVKENTPNWEKSGLADIAGKLSIISSGEWDVEDLNKIFHNSGYITSFLLRENIDVADLTMANFMQQLNRKENC